MGGTLAGCDHCTLPGLAGALESWGILTMVHAFDRLLERHFGSRREKNKKIVGSG